MSKPKPLVSFICQKCSQPLKLDPSISPSQIATLNRSNSGKDSVQVTLSPLEEIRDQDAEIQFVPNTRLENSEICNDFTILALPDNHMEEILSRNMMITCHLFDVLSGQTEVDHPICEECTDNLLDQLDQQLNQAQNEYQQYSKLLEKLNCSNDDVDVRKLDGELKKLSEEEIKLEREMVEMEKKQKEIEIELTREKKILSRLEEDSKKYHKQYHEYKRQLIEYEDAQKSIDNQLKYATKQLERLTKSNVFNVTFHIWYQGHFGTINGFRLGRLPGVPVDWNEINAGWGQAALLLHSLGNKIGLIFKRYRVIPYGNRSYMESLTDKNKEFPLYGSGGFKFFWDTKFDDGMVAYLDCLQQFKEELERRNPDCCMPYKIDGGRIVDSKTRIPYTIKVLLNSEEQWTKALKLMLTNLKWGLVWVTADGCQSNGEEVTPLPAETPEMNRNASNKRTASKSDRDATDTNKTVAEAEAKSNEKGTSGLPKTTEQTVNKQS